MEGGTDLEAIYVNDRRLNKSEIRMWEIIVRLNDEEARRVARGIESNWSNAADPGGNDYHQVRDEMTRLEDFNLQMSLNPNEWVSFGQTWHLYANRKGWYRWICATATLTQCREEQLKDEWAKEHCQIIATYPSDRHATGRAEDAKSFIERNSGHKGTPRRTR